MEIKGIVPGPNGEPVEAWLQVSEEEMERLRGNRFQGISIGCIPWDSGHLLETSIVPEGAVPLEIPA